MKNEKKEFIKKFDVAIEDLLDNYEKYTDEEKAQVTEIPTETGRQCLWHSVCIMPTYRRMRFPGVRAFII